MPSSSSSRALRASFAGASPAPPLTALGEAELRLLRSFATAVDAGGLSAAAAAMQVDLSTVSRQFRELEQWLGVRLATRGRGGFVLTPDGQRLHALTRQFFGTMASFSSELAALGGASRPVLRLGIVDALLTAAPLQAGRELPAVLARCIDETPGLEIHLKTLRPLEIGRALLAGALDAGILAAHPPVSGLEQHRLYAEPSSLYVGPGHPWHAQPQREIPEEELERAAFVTDPYFETIPHDGLTALIARRARTRADSIEGAALLVCTGRYAGFLPDHLVAQVATLQSLRAVQPARFSYRHDIVLACRAGKADPLLRRLIRWLPASAG